MNKRKMGQRKKLALNRETLTHLQHPGLSQVAGGFTGLCTMAPAICEESIIPYCSGYYTDPTQEGSLGCGVVSQRTCPTTVAPC